MPENVTRAAVNDLLQYPCDCVCECDRCHHVRPCWEDSESAGAGDWTYCADCWQALARAAAVKRSQLLERWASRSRRELIAELGRIDPNGRWSDAESRAEGHEPMTAKEALDHLLAILMRA